MNQLLALLWTVTCLFGSGSAAFAQTQTPPQKVGLIACGPDVRVDEFFQRHLATIAQVLQRRERVPDGETEFVYVAGFLSGIDFPLASYSGRPKLQPVHVDAFRTWYEQHRDRICWQQITQLQALLAEPLLSDEQIDRMESFKIK
jgi:hypothetical protein